MFRINLQEVRLARQANMGPEVLSSKEHVVNALLADEPRRMLMSLGEIGDMLAFLPR